MSLQNMKPTLILLSVVLLAMPSAFGYSVTLNSSTPTFTALGSGVNPNGGNALSASAKFTLSAGTLTIVLTNTGPAARVPSDVLTGVFFTASHNLPATPTTPKSNATAILTAGSTVVKEGATVTVPGGNVGGEFAYRSGLGAGAPATQGISSSGLGLFGPENRFDTSSNLAGPDSPDGLQYGIVSGIATNANKKVKEEEPLIKSSVTFTFKNLSFSELILTKLVFQYGTDLSEPQLLCTNCDLRTPPVPEPSFYGLLSLGLGGLFWIARRRKAA